MEDPLRNGQAVAPVVLGDCEQTEAVPMRNIIMSLSMLSVLGLGACQQEPGATAKDKLAASSPIDEKTSILAAIAARNFGEAAKQARALATAAPSDPEAWLLLARSEALIANQGEALDALDHAVKAGLANAKHALDDPAFDAVRRTERFLAIAQRAIPSSRPPASKGSVAPHSSRVGHPEVEIGRIVPLIGTWHGLPLREVRFVGTDDTGFDWMEFVFDAPPSMVGGVTSKLGFGVRKAGDVVEKDFDGPSLLISPTTEKTATVLTCGLLT